PEPDVRRRPIDERLPPEIRHELELAHRHVERRLDLEPRHDKVARQRAAVAIDATVGAAVDALQIAPQRLGARRDIERADVDEVAEGVVRGVYDLLELRPGCEIPSEEPAVLRTAEGIGRLHIFEAVVAG